MGGLTAERIAVVGVGAMGGALVEGLLTIAGRSPKELHVADRLPERLERWRHLGVPAFERAEEAVAAADIVLLAVKPKDAAEALSAIRAALPARAVVVSVLAGVPLAALRSGLGHGGAIVRAMPNLAVAVGHGVTALAADERVDGAARRHVDALFRALGAVAWVPETALDGITALSGSGPAYVYLFLEGLAAAGESLGLEPALARRLAVETALGAAALARSSETELGALRAAVTSPKGTTAAALAVLEGAGFRELVGAAVRAAARRARELAVESGQALAAGGGEP